MENKEKTIEQKKMWKIVHTPLKERKSSSGLTFRCKEVAVNEQKHTMESSAVKLRIHM